MENGSFSNVCEKCHVGDVTVGGASVVSTSGFRFPVGHDLTRSTCCDDCLENVYFRRERCSKVGKLKSFDNDKNGITRARTKFLPHLSEQKYEMIMIIALVNSARQSSINARNCEAAESIHETRTKLALSVCRKACLLSSSHDRDHELYQSTRNN